MVRYGQHIMIASCVYVLHKNSFTTTSAELPQIALMPDQYSLPHERRHKTKNGAKEHKISGNQTCLQAWRQGGPRPIGSHASMNRKQAADHAEEHLGSWMDGIKCQQPIANEMRLSISKPWKAQAQVSNPNTPPPPLSKTVSALNSRCIHMLYIVYTRVRQAVHSSRISLTSSMKSAIALHGRMVPMPCLDKLVNVCLLVHALLFIDRQAQTLYSLFNEFICGTFITASAF